MPSFVEQYDEDVWQVARDTSGRLYAIGAIEVLDRTDVEKEIYEALKRYLTSKRFQLRGEDAER